MRAFPHRPLDGGAAAVRRTPRSPRRVWAAVASTGIAAFLVGPASAATSWGLGPAHRSTAQPTTADQTMVERSTPGPTVAMDPAALDPSLAEIGPERSGWLRIAHLDEPAPSVSVAIDGRMAVPSLAPGAYTGFLAVAPGLHRLSFEFAAAGRTRVSVVVAPGSSMTLIPRGPDRKPAAVAVADDEWSPHVDGPSPGSAESSPMQARLRVVHLARSSVLVARGIASLGEVPPLRSSRYAFVDAGPVPLELREAETGANVVGRRVLDVEPGSSWTVLVDERRPGVTAVRAVQDPPASITAPPGWRRPTGPPSAAGVRQPDRRTRLAVATPRATPSVPDRADPVMSVRALALRTPSAPSRSDTTLWAVLLLAGAGLIVAGRDARQTVRPPRRP